MPVEKRPNILLLHTDQQRFDTIAALGAAHMQTPNLDRLVRMGTTFCNAYSSNPVCMPARHDLLTGASARHHGYYGNSNTFLKEPGLATVPRLLTQSGYQTIGVGKMHHNPPREHHGWAHLFLMEELPESREDDAYLQYLAKVGYGHIRCQHGVRPFFYHTPQPARVPEEHHGSAWVAHKTIELIETERDRPWFMMASWVGPHPPYYVPPKYLRHYAGAELPSPCPIPPGGERHAPPSPENPEAGEPRLQQMREAYFAAITLIDTHIGRILDALEQRGELENTLILLMSDHGEMLGDRDAYQKHYPYEGSAHIPLIACGPGFARNQRCLTPVTTWDVAATILEATGVSVPAGHPLVGQCLSEIAATNPCRTIVFHHGNGRQRYVAAVGDGHKFVHWYNGGEEELYALETDPWEQVNLLSRTATPPAVYNTLREACLRFETEHGVAERVRGNAFVDDAYQPPHPHLCSLYPPWSYKQFPPWMNGYSREDLDAIAAEMRDCLNSDLAYICREPEWRANAMDVWTGMGGERDVLQKIYDDADAKWD